MRDEEDEEAASTRGATLLLLPAADRDASAAVRRIDLLSVDDDMMARVRGVVARRRGEVEVVVGNWSCVVEAWQSVPRRRRRLDLGQLLLPRAPDEPGASDYKRRRLISHGACDGIAVEEAATDR